jgi:hypothetical protein
MHDNLDRVTDPLRTDATDATDATDNRDLEAERREHLQGWLMLAAIFGGLALLVVLAATLS